MKIDVQYTSIEDNSALNKKLIELLTSLEDVNPQKPKFVWAFRSMGVWISLYPITVEGKDTFLIRTRTARGTTFEIADSFKLVNVIIKRETSGSQWLEDSRISTVMEFLKDIEAVDLTEVLNEYQSAV